MPGLAAGLPAPASLLCSTSGKPLLSPRPGALPRRQRPRVAAPAARALSAGRPAQEGASPARSPRLRRARSRQQPRGPQPEPFDAELLILFGMPVLVLGIAYAFNDPRSLAVALPLALLVPGPRDVLLHVAADLLRAAVRARNFVSTDSDDDGAAATAFAAARQRRQAGRARPPPPPPPPPPAVEVELQPGDYAVHPLPPPSPQQLPQQPPARRQQRASPCAPQPEVRAAAWRQDGAAAADSTQPNWPAAGEGSAGTRPQQQDWRGASRGWPATPAAAPSSRRLQYRGGSTASGTTAGPATPRSSPPAVGRQRRSRGRLSRSVGNNGALGQGWGGSDNASTPLLMRPIFALIPFLRYWGGFL